MWEIARAWGMVRVGRVDFLWGLLCGFMLSGSCYIRWSIGSVGEEGGVGEVGVLVKGKWKEGDKSNKIK